MRFENQGTNRYLLYDVRPEDVIDTLSLGMLTNNKISGLAETMFTQMDRNKFIRYNVSTKVSAKDFFSGIVSKKGFLKVFYSIVDAILSAEEYMINIDSIIMDLEYIFIDPTTGDTALICLPIERENKSVDLSRFFKNMMVNVKLEQTKDFDYFGKILNYLNSHPALSLNDLKKLLNEIKNNPTPHIKPTPLQPVTPSEKKNKVPSGKSHVPQPLQPVQSVKTEWDDQIKELEAKGININMYWLLSHYSKQNREIYSAWKAVKKDGGKKAKRKGETAPDLEFEIPGQKQKQKKTMPPKKKEEVSKKSDSKNKERPDFGPTIIVTPDEQESLIREPEPYLIRLKNDDRVPINTDEFTMGRNVGHVDYYISGSKAVSRNHAKIVNRDNRFFIIDNNSTNYTYVDGNRIPSDKEIELNHGTKFRLANEDFEFRIY